MTPARKAELRALCEAATPGPWESHALGGGKGHGSHYSVRRDDGISDADSHVAVCKRGNHDNARNAAFIAAARTAIPELLDALEAAENERRGVGTAEARSIAKKVRDAALEEAAREAEKSFCCVCGGALLVPDDGERCEDCSIATAEDDDPEFHPKRYGIAERIRALKVPW